MGERPQDVPPLENLIVYNFLQVIKTKQKFSKARRFLRLK